MVLALLVCRGEVAAGSEVTVLQNGVAPTPGYTGCIDTWISDEQWERNRDNGGGETVRCGGKRRILIRFDLKSIPDNHHIHRAVLRLSNRGYPPFAKQTARLHSPIRTFPLFALSIPLRLQISVISASAYAGADDVVLVQKEKPEASIVIADNPTHSA